jgi:hypothetical protein
MKKLWLASVTVSGVVVVALHAQNTTPSLNANRVTVTGCIERASTQRPTGTTATTTPAGTAVPDTQFLLANATSATTNPAGSGAATAARSTAVTATIYRLDDADVSKVSPHVGHEVTITGTIEDLGRPDPAAAGSAGTARPSRASSSGANSPKLKVGSIKMISSNCPD